MSQESAEPRRVGLLRATGVVSAFTLLSRILGLVRDIVIANVFGVSRVTEAFFVANKIPNMMRRFFAEGAFSQGFVPVLNDYKMRRTVGDTATFVAAVSGTLGGFLLALTGVGVLFAPMLVIAIAPGFAADDRFDLTVAMLRWTFPYLLFVSLAALASGVLNSYGRFALPSLAPVLLNAALIIAALLVAPQLDEPGMALAGAVFVAGILQVLILLPSLQRLRLLRLPRWSPASDGVKRVLKLMLPAMVGSSVAQINIFIDNVIASILMAGSVSWLYYSDRLMEFPLGVFGIALATAILPQLSSQHASGRAADFTATLDRGLRLVFAIGLPATAGLIVMSGPLVITLFQRGAFTATDVVMTQWSLVAFSTGLLGFMLVKVLAPGFFARLDTRTPLRCGLVALAVNVVLNGTFVLLALRYGWVAPHAGLAAATSIAAWVNAALLYRGLRQASVLAHHPGWPGLVGQVTVATVVMVATLLWLVPASPTWTDWGQLQRTSALLAWVGLGGVVFVVIAMGLGLRVGTFAAGTASQKES
ncbi:MAG: murein biosynthesis integral membrane protein MurJ [Pseudomonadota bacterium]